MSFFVSTGNESRNDFRLSIRLWHTMHRSTMGYSRGLAVVPPMGAKDTFPALATDFPYNWVTPAVHRVVLMISDLLGSNGFLLVVTGLPNDRGASVFRVNQSTLT